MLMLSMPLSYKIINKILMFYYLIINMLCKRKDEIRSLREEIQNLPDIKKLDSQADNEWLNNRLSLRSEIMTGDPRFFLEWNVIRKTMFVVNAIFTDKELSEIKQSKLWEERYRKGIFETSIGNPALSSRYPAVSDNSIHHLYHIFRFESNSGISIDKCKLIVEFGGGYGSFCRIVHKLGFKGVYIIYDFDEYNALQRFYLNMCSIPVSYSNNVASFDNGVYCVSNINALKSILSINDKHDVFIGLWSISETSLAIRQQVMEQLDGFNNYFISFQKQFGEVDNYLFFSEFIDKNKKVTWCLDEIEHLPGHYYMIGSRKC